MNYPFLIFIGCWLLACTACNDDYFADGGIINKEAGVFEGTTMAYLESQPQSFDTLVALIKLCGLEQAVNTPGSTFFAPRDYSVHNYFKLLFAELDTWPASLDDINDEDRALMAGLLRQYIIPDKRLMRQDLQTSYSYLTTLGGRKARFNLVREDYLGNVNMGAQSIIFSLNMAADGQREFYQSVRVVVSDIQSATGVVQVLDSDTHILGFN